MKIINWFKKASLLKKGLIIVGIIAMIFLGKTFIFKNTQNKPQYQTATAEKGTLIEAVTASGSVSSVNGITVNTQASGVVSEVSVQNGDIVAEGATLAKIKLDQSGQQKNSQAYASYLSAKNTVDSANANAYSLRSAKDTAWKKYYDTATSSQYQNSDGTPRDDMRNSSAEFQSAQGDWLAAEAKYKNQQAVITQAQVSLNAAWLSYLESSDTITAPMAGTVSDFSLQAGTILASSSSSSSTSTSSSSSSGSSQKVAMVKTDAAPTVSVSLTEIDAPKVKIGNKATITFDAFSGKTYTGKVLSIDTSGSVSSGVTTYPATIALDSPPENILSNMSASASIITNTKNNIVIVPSAAVKTQDGESTVQILKNGVAQTVTVETGLSNDTQIEVVSGVNEGDVVITGQSTSTTGTGASRSSGSSPFSGGGFGGAGGARTIQRIN